MDAENFPPIVLELLHTHAKLCRFHRTNHVHWNRWLDHFYRGELTWSAFGKESEKRKLSSPPRISQRDRLSTFKCHQHWGACCFPGFLIESLCLPYQNEVIRPETFVMASLIANGRKISLAAIVLG